MEGEELTLQDVALLVPRATWSERLQWLLGWLFHGYRVATADEVAAQRRHDAQLEVLRQAKSVEVANLQMEIEAHLITISDREMELRDVRQQLATLQGEFMVVKREGLLLLEVNERDMARVKAESQRPSSARRRPNKARCGLSRPEHSTRRAEVET